MLPLQCLNLAPPLIAHTAHTRHTLAARALSNPAPAWLEYQPTLPHLAILVTHETPSWSALERALIANWIGDYQVFTAWRRIDGEGKPYFMFDFGSYESGSRANESPTL